jgi:23S rRNA (adenine2503-C2)-methyltransferase
MPAPKARLLDLSPDELRRLVASLGEKPYRADQIEGWLFRRGAGSIDDFSDVSKKSRQNLAKVAEIAPTLTLVESAESADGSRKLLFSAPDDELIESVLIPERDHYTLCLSSQIGCVLGCRFCRTGTLGFKRNLTQGEILGQIFLAKKFLGQNANLANLVFMGMGEPLLNLDAVISALKLIVSPKALALSGKKVSISTAGLPPALVKLAESRLNVSLTVSLGAPDDITREKIGRAHV